MLKSLRSKICKIYIQSWKQCALLLITTMTLQQLIQLGTWCMVTHCWYQWTKKCTTSKARTLIVFMIACILCPSSFSEIWALCVSWITNDHLHYAPSFACWAIFGSLVPAMCNHTSCGQVHELPQSHCSDNWEGRKACNTFTKRAYTKIWFWLTCIAS